MSTFSNTAAPLETVAGPPTGYGQQHCVVSHRGETIAPAILDRLEMLDDALFAALAGDEKAIDEFCAMWRRAANSTPDELLEDSREQYLKHAQRRSDSSSAQRLLGLLDESADAA